jgi:uncharacterized protein YkwD
MRTAYQNVLVPALSVPIGWTGSVSGCVAGAPSAAAQQATLTAVNFFRQMVGVRDVTFDAALSAKAQDAALMMDAAGALSHYPDTSWPCYTSAGANAAGSSNLYLGRTGAEAMRGYMVDPGSNNTAVGHRRWLIDPWQVTMGSGSTTKANSLYVFGPRTAPGPDTPEWLSWPTPGYFPLQLDPASGNSRWSLSARDNTTTFTAATVSVSSNGVPIPVTVQPIAVGYGPNTIVWEFLPGYAPGLRDRRYDVTVANIDRNGVPTSHSYSVTLFDADFDPDQSITMGTLSGRTYGDAPFALSATASSGLAVSFSSTTPSVCTTGGALGATVTINGAGTCTIKADQPGTTRWNPAPTQTRSFTVTKAPLTIQPRSAARSSGAANPTFAVDYSGFVGGQTLPTSGVSGQPSCSSTALVSSPVGDYPITCTTGTLASANYSFVFGTSTLTVADGLVATSPARLLDTRPDGITIDGIAQAGGAIGPGATRNLVVTGRAGIPISGVDAVVLNITAVGPTATSHLTVWPTGDTRPNASNLNYTPGQVVPNLVIAKVGAGGQVSIFNNTGSVHVIADIAGWFPTGPGYTPLTPTRLLDTRPDGITIDGIAQAGGAIGPAGKIDLQVTGRGGVPATGVGAVILNITAVSPTATSHLTVWPAGSPRPTASNLNYNPGQVVPNLVVARVGAGGKVSLYNNSGSVNLIADVAGWIP